MKLVLAVAVGGAMGSVLRYGISNISRVLSPDFPAGTLFVNVAGSFVMGGLAALFMSRFVDQEVARLFWLTGVLGGFTTFSAFSLDALLLLQQGRATAALAYVGLSVGLALMAVVAGYSCFKLLS